MSEKRHRVSRRQFLNYTLTGVGGFMAAGMLMPMVRFALDPVLRPTEDQDMVQVVSVDELTNEPQIASILKSNKWMPGTNRKNRDRRGFSKVGTKL